MQIPLIGWLVIAFIATLIFIVLMSKGLKFGFSGKTVSIGEKMDKKIGDFKQEIEKKELERVYDESFSRELLRKSQKIDEHLSAECRKSVRRIDRDVAPIFKNYLKSPLSIAAVASLIKEELNERLDYNNMKEKLSRNERTAYCNDIVNDIHDRYSTFYLQAEKLVGKGVYPEWETVERNVQILISVWSIKIINSYISHLNRKIELYQQSRKVFKTEEYKQKSIDYPIQKNQNYIKMLGGKK